MIKVPCGVFDKIPHKKMDHFFFHIIFDNIWISKKKQNVDSYFGRFASIKKMGSDSTWSNFWNLLALKISDHGFFLFRKSVEAWCLLEYHNARNTFTGNLYHALRINEVNTFTGNLYYALRINESILSIDDKLEKMFLLLCSKLKNQEFPVIAGLWRLIVTPWSSL